MNEPAHKFGWKRDNPDYRDFQYVALSNVTLPPSVDLRNQDTHIRDQGQLGSCTAFAIEGHFNFLNQKEGMSPFLGSPLFVYYNERRDMGTVNSDSGASIRESVKTCLVDGVAPETDWPYLTARFTQSPPALAYTNARAHMVTQYLSVGQDLTTMKTCIASGFPFVFGFSVFQNFESAQTASTGIVGMPSGSYLGGHAMMALGYIDATQSFICRNSWGTGFGDHGYVYMPMAYLTNQQLAADIWTLRLVTGVQPAPPTPTPTPTPVPVQKVHQVDVFSDGSLKVVI